MSEALEQSGLREGYKEVQFGPKTLVVPSDWSTVRFGDVFDRRRESIDDLEDETIKYVGLKHLDSGQLTINGFDEDGRERSSSRVFREGDVLFGKLRPNLNKAAVAPFSGVCSSDIIPIYAKKDGRQQFLPYLMHSKLVRDRAVSTMEGTNLPRTSWGDLEKTLVPLPPLPEQRRIADILSTVDEQIQQTDEIIKKSEELRSGQLQNILHQGFEAHDIVEHRIGPKEVLLPDAWTVQRIDELLSDGADGKPLRGGPPGGKIHKKDRVEGGYKLYTQEVITKRNINYGDEYLSAESFKELKAAEPKPGDILITRAGTVGESIVFPEDAERGIIDSALMRLRINESVCDPHFVSLLIDESYLVEFQIRAMSQSGVVRNLNNGIIKQLQIPVPPLKEQQKVVEVMSKFSDKIEQEIQYKESLQELKRGLMQDLLTGKVRVNTD